jgi:Tfp pilus assembly protein PilV
MMRNLFLKLKSTAGESLAETLVALLITCMGLVILPGAIVAASKVTRKSQEASMTDNPTITTTGSVQIKGSGSAEEIGKYTKMTYKQTGNELAYYYYTVNWTPTQTGN